MEAEIIRHLQDMKRMQDSVSLRFRINSERIERKKEDLEALRKEQHQRQDLNQREREMRDNLIKEREMAILVYQKVHEDGMSAVEEINRETELRLRQAIECFVQKQARELQFLNDRRAKMYVKRMEELDRQQFMDAVKVKYGTTDSTKAEELYSLWGGYLSDPSWHPFKTVMGGENDEVVVDENDKKLKELKNEFGGEVYEVVVKALNKFNKNNPHASDPVPVLWNNSENRAALKDAFAGLYMRWKIQRRKRPRH